MIVFVLSITSVVYSTKPHKHIIYVDDINGVKNTSCWYGGIDMPCKSWSLANEGRQLGLNIIIATIDTSTFSESLSINQLDNPDCPLWMYHDKESGECQCSDIPYQAVHCDPTIPRTSLLDCYCMTYDTEQNQTQLGLCVYGCKHKGHQDFVYYSLPNTTSELNEFMCGYEQRTSTLCGKCKDGYSPLVYSYGLRCMNCTGVSYNWIKYVAIAYIPLTGFFFVVVLFKFSGTSPMMRTFIVVCQGIASPISIRVFLKSGEHASYHGWAVKFLATVYGIWNLDFFRTIIPPICLHITPLQALLLDYGVAFYPIVLVIITYILISLHSHDVRIVVWMWKPFQRILNLSKKEFQGSIANALATFLLLSYFKVLDTSFDFLMYSELYTLNGSSYTVMHDLFYDASIEMFGKEHLPYAITAIVVMLVAIVAPLIFLILYPMKWFQKCLNALHIRRESVVIFVDCFQGYYKDGTNGTRDYRYFSVMLYLLHISIFCMFALSKNAYCYPAGALILILASILTLFCQPYKEQFKVYCLSDAILLQIEACLLIAISVADTG